MKKNNKDEKFDFPIYAAEPLKLLPLKTTSMVYNFLHECEGRFESAKIEIDKDKISLNVILSNKIPEKAGENEQD